MQATDKIWMNGELVDGADAKVHVGVHGLHYGSGVFEGIRCYETPKGPAVLPARRASAAPPRLGTAAAHGDPVLGRGAAVGDPRPRGRERPSGATSARRLLRLRRARRRHAGQPGRDGDDELALGRIPGRGGLTKGIRRRLVAGSASAPNIVPHASKASGVYLNSMLGDDRGRRGGLRRGDPAHRRRDSSPTGRARTSSSSGTAHLHAPPLDRDPARDHPRLGHPDRPGSRLRRSMEKPLIRSDLYLADEVFMCGTAAEVTPVRAVDDQEIGRRPGHEGDPGDVPRHGARPQTSAGRSGSSSSPA